MTDLNQMQLDWCRAHIPAFSRAHDAATASIASTAEYRAKYGDALALSRAKAPTALFHVELAAPIRWKWGSP
jgi:hypothetical protein